jgi:Isochorismatase family
MARFPELRSALLAALAAALLVLPVGAHNASAGTQSDVGVPAIPDPVAVSLDPTTTAFLALDFLQSNCQPRPPCVASLPAVGFGLEQARATNAMVVYSDTGPTQTILDAVAPNPGDPKVSSSADKFFNTDLDNILKNAGISTVVITGTSSNGAVLYTAYGAVERGYTVVIAVDGISASNDFANQFTEWQLLNLPGPSNPQNMSLQPKAVTLSRTDLITYK